MGRKRKMTKRFRKGARKGQTKPRVVRGKRVYFKAGKMHKVSYARDKKIKAKHTRKPKQASWRGDVKGKRV